MTTAVYANAKLDLASGDLSLLSATLKAMAIQGSTYAPNFSTDQYLSDVPSGARATSGVSLTGKTLTKSGTAVRLRSDPVAFSGSPVGDESLTAILLYEDTGTAGTSRLVGYFDYFSNLPLAPSGGTWEVTFAWPTEGMLIITEGALGLVGPAGPPGPQGPAGVLGAALTITVSPVVDIDTLYDDPPEITHVVAAGLGTLTIRGAKPPPAGMTGMLAITNRNADDATLEIALDDPIGAAANGFFFNAPIDTIKMIIAGGDTVLWFYVHTENRWMPVGGTWTTDT